MTISGRYWALAIVFLLLIIATGVIVILLRFNPGQPIEISPANGQETDGLVNIGGGVANPGYRPFAGTDSIESLIQAAGGITENADLSRVQLYIPESEEGQEAQKIDINRADVWLLKALPGIGETLAQRIVDYRQQNGPFSNINQIVKVAGIAAGTYEQIKDLITVND
jgi:competence protein ComEA